MPITIRSAGANDLPIIQRTLFLALTWNGTPEGMTFERAMAHEYVSQYHSGWGRDGDVGVVAEQEGEAIGASYGRLFTDEQHGHGYIDPQTPEIAIAVSPGHVGKGIGSQLLHALEDTYRGIGVARLSLSVELANRAMQLYQRFGYVEVDRDDDAARMVKDL